MRIKNLSGDIKREPPRLGVLKKGDPAEERVGKNGKTYTHFGAERPWWRMHAPQKGTFNPDAIRAFEDLFCESDQDGTLIGPSELHVRLYGDTVDDVFPSAYTENDARGMVRLCDGEIIHVWRDGGKYVRNDPKQCARDNGGCKCKASADLKVIIPELSRAGFVGIVDVHTNSMVDIMRITGVLEWIQHDVVNRYNEKALSLNRPLIGMSGIPVIIRRGPLETIGFEDKGERKTSKGNHFIQISLAPEFFEELERRIGPVGILGEPPPPPAITGPVQGIVIEDDPTEDEPQAVHDEIEFRMITNDQIEEINLLGEQVYADGWKSTRSKLISWANKTYGDRESDRMDDLTEDEAATLIRKLLKRYDEILQNQKIRESAESEESPAEDDPAPEESGEPVPAEASGEVPTEETPF